MSETPQAPGPPPAADPAGSTAVDLTALRRRYGRAGLSEEGLAGSWLEQLTSWIADAVAADLAEANAMVVATATADGRPGARTVLLKGVDERGLVFFTNYESRKGRELATNPRASCVIRWVDLERQVVVDGAAELLAAADSDAYFRSRPLGSRLSAWASQQSRVIPDRTWLTERLARAGADYGEDPPRPPWWGGVRVVPESVEFWQGRPDRLHDRLRFRRAEAGEWLVERLSP